MVRELQTGETTCIPLITSSGKGTTTKQQLLYSSNTGYNILVNEIYFEKILNLAFYYEKWFLK